MTLHFFDNGDTVKNFSVNMNYPKMELTEMTKTVLELVSCLYSTPMLSHVLFQGLHPRGMLYVNDLDS